MFVPSGLLLMWAMQAAATPHAGVPFGPFNLTMDVSVTGLASLVSLVVIAVALIRHLTLVGERVEQMWKALMGEGPQDQENFFYRFAVIEQRVTEMWERLRFDQFKRDSK